MFAVFHNGKQVSKPHPNQWAAEIEAYELGLVVRSYRQGPKMVREAEIRCLECGRQGENNE